MLLNSQFQLCSVYLYYAERLIQAAALNFLCMIIKLQMTHY